MNGCAYLNNIHHHKSGFMKKIFLVTAIIFAMGMVACQKETIVNAPNRDTEKAFLSGSPDAKFGPVALLTWKIDLFTKNNEDITSRFSPFRFEIASDNSAVATDGKVFIPGKWDIVNDQYFFYFEISGVELSGAQVDYDLTIFNDLNGYWNIVKKYPDAVLLEMTGAKLYKQMRMSRY
jgi:hypothetical protein